MIRTPELTIDTPIYADLAEMLRAHAIRRDDLAIQFHGCRDIDDNYQLTYGELWDRSVAASHVLAKDGVVSGDKVIILLPTGINFTVYFFGTILCGATPVPLIADLNQKDAALYLAQLRPAVIDCRAKHCVAFPQLAEVLRGEFAELKYITELVPKGSEVSQGLSPLPVTIKPDDVALIQYTSGSTSAPKGVTLTHKNLMSNLYAISKTLQVTPGIDIAVSWLPLYHDMGLIGMFLSAIYPGVPLHLMPPQSFVRTPKRWLKLITEYKGTITTVPNFAFHLCLTRCETEGLDLSSLRVLMNGSEPISSEDLNAFAEKFEPVGLRAACITPVYGMAESAVAVTFCGDGPPKIDCIAYDELMTSRHAVPVEDGMRSKSVVCVGSPIFSQQVRIVDDHESQMKDGQVGNIEIKGPSIMNGYYGKEDLTKQLIKNGWFTTGDLGYMKAGELYITGRAKDVIIHNGRNYYPQDIEHQVEKHPLVRPGRTIAFWMPENSESRYGVVVLFESKSKEAEAKMQVAREVTVIVSKTSGLPVKDVRVVENGRIPLTTSGKVRRQPAKELYMELAS